VSDLLIDHVDYDGEAGTVSIAFHPTGIKTLVKEQNHGAAA
jgi:hypothetical protein